MENNVDEILLNFSEASLNTLNIALAVIMFGIALDLTPADFRRLFKTPRSVGVGLFSQFLLLPALTYVLILIFEPLPTMALGMILVAACPGGNVSNFISTVSHGNVALSVTLTAFASVLAIFLTPLNYTLWGGMLPGTEALNETFQIDPGKVVLTIVGLLAVPLLLGMYVNYAMPQLVAKIKRPIRILSIIIFAAFVVIAFLKNFDYFTQVMHLIVGLVFVHNAVAFFSGYSLASLFRLDTPSRRAITIETGIQNSGLALVIIFNFFDGVGGMALIAAWWGIWHLLAGSALGYFWSRRPTTAPAAE